MTIHKPLEVPRLREPVITGTFRARICSSPSFMSRFFFLSPSSLSPPFPSFLVSSSPPSFFPFLTSGGLIRLRSNVEKLVWLSLGTAMGTVRHKLSSPHPEASVEREQSRWPAAPRHWEAWQEMPVVDSCRWSGLWHTALYDALQYTEHSVTPVSPMISM